MKIHFTTTKEILTPSAGLAGVGQLLSLTNLKLRLNQTRIEENVRPSIPHGDVVFAYLGLLCQGKSDFDQIEALRDDEWFGRSLDLKVVPSSPTLRQRLDQGALCEPWLKIIQNENANLIRRGRAVITPVKTGKTSCVPLDIDVSPFDNSNTKKEGVSRTYKGFDGYSPIFAYLGREGYAVHVEMRHGKDHCQKGTAAFLAETIRLSRAITEQPLLVRMDAGNDSRDNLHVCLEAGVNLLIKRNLRKENPDFWLQYARQHGTARSPRPGKTVYQGVKEITVTCDGQSFPLRQVYIVTERTVLHDGQILLVPDVEAATYWTTLDLDPQAIEALYHDHATSEQFHSEIKTDMDLERLPSGKLKTNQLVLQLGIMAYNVLRMMGQFSVASPLTPLRKKAERRRIRTVIQNLITCAARLIHHGRQLVLGFTATDKWAVVLRDLYAHFRATGEASS